MFVHVNVSVQVYLDLCVYLFFCACKWFCVRDLCVLCFAMLLLCWTGDLAVNERVCNAEHRKSSVSWWGKSCWCWRVDVFQGLVIRCICTFVHVTLSTCILTHMFPLTHLWLKSQTLWWKRRVAGRKGRLGGKLIPEQWGLSTLESLPLWSIDNVVVNSYKWV